MNLLPGIEVKTRRSGTVHKVKSVGESRDGKVWGVTPCGLTFWSEAALPPDKECNCERCLMWG